MAGAKTTPSPLLARPGLLAPCALLVGGIAGCGSDTVDANKVEQGIEQELSTANITSVSCPADVKSETGAKFACDAKLSGGGAAQIEVTQVQAPNKFTYSLKPGTVELAGPAVDKTLEQDLAAQGVHNA